MTPLLGVFLPVTIAYAATLVWVYRMWGYGDEGYYAHAPLVVVFAVVMVFAWRSRWRVEERVFDPRGWYLLGPGLFLHLIGVAAMINSASGYSLILSLAGAAWLALGFERFKVLLPILGLAAFVIPAPVMVQSSMVFHLKEFAIRAGLDLANLMGAGAERLGADIRFPGMEGTLVVADPCSGLRSLVSLTTLGYCVAFFLGKRTGARPWILLAAAAPIAVLTNVLRIAAICWAARHVGIDFATGTGHDIASIGIWIVDLALLLALDAWLTRLRKPSR